uniref:Dephospho-CoA kinase n=1 Tax=Oryza punctata TaxID=4537 RepID=A0A0E0JID7_ORYPU
MRLVGLTGGIASGNCTISNLFKASGIPVVDADIVARNVVQKGTGRWKKIVEAFGNDVLLENGEIDRARLGQIVFSDPEKRQSSGSTYFIWDILGDTKTVIVLDIPLLFETKMDQWTHPVIVVWVNEATQIERLMSRDGCSEEQARNRINAQLALDWKKSQADIVIDNSGTLDETKKNFEAVLRKVSEPLTWKERLRSRDGLFSAVVCTAVGVLLAQKNLL